MKAHQRHKLEYLLHHLDDQDLAEATQVLSEPRERVMVAHWVGGRSVSSSSNLRTMLVITIGMAAVSIVSLIYAHSSPWALYIVPAYSGYIALALLAQVRKLQTFH